MSEISTDEQMCSDFDWFCVDEAGYIGHFTTAGFKMLPPSVANSADDLALVTTFFENEARAGKGYRVDSELALELTPPQCFSEAYLRSFVAMADRGLFSFDISSYLGSESQYFRVASPSRPLKLDDLPDRVQQIVRRTELKGILLKDSSRIAYQRTLGM